MSVLDNKDTLINITSKLKIEFPNSSIGLIGCRTTNESYLPCEYDFIVTLPGSNDIERRLMLNNFVDLLFIDLDTFLNRPRELIEFAFADMKIIEDPKWILASLSHSYKKDLIKYYRYYAKREIFKSLTELGRYEESLQAKKKEAAGFWLTNSCYSLSSSLILHNKITPRPSHFLSEFKKIGPPSEIFEIWSEIMGLRYATGITLHRRLEALGDIIQKRSKIESKLPLQTRLTYQLNEAKMNHLIKKHATMDAFVSLGNELNRQLKSLYELKCKANNEPLKYEMIFENIEDKDNIIGQLSKQTIRMINLNYDDEEIRAKSSKLKDFILFIAKKLSREKEQG